MNVKCPFCLSRPNQPCRDDKGRFMRGMHVIRREISRGRYKR